jgi:hypothetical protein
MSLQIQAKIICDTCGKTLTGPVTVKSTKGMESYFTVKMEAKNGGWVVLSRNGRHLHVCPNCGDKPKPKENLVSEDGASGKRYTEAFWALMDEEKH